MVRGRDAAIVFKEEGEEDAASSRVRSHCGELALAGRPGRSRTESCSRAPAETGSAGLGWLIRAHLVTQCLLRY